MKKKDFDKYGHYENSVQSPEENVAIYDRMFRELRGRPALSLREDFCGTYLISQHWVKSHPERTAVGLDLDPEPLAYAKKNHIPKLSAAVKRRLTVRQQDVLHPSRDHFDVIAAGNFSFNVFKDRKTLKKYFDSAKKSLNAQGIFALELAGGPSFIETAREQRTYRVKGLGKFTYYWDQKKFDPINHHGVYAIHFKTETYGMLRDQFVYDWRVWTIPELRDAMRDVGFSDVVVYWEANDSDGEGTGEYLRAESGDNAHSWIAFVVGIR